MSITGGFFASGGDMKKSDYDIDKDGHIDDVETLDSNLDGRVDKDSEKKLTVIASDTVITEDTTIKSSAATSPTKIKEITMTIENDIVQPVTLRTVFGLRSDNAAYTVYGRIYKNDMPAGTLRSTTSTSYQTYTEDIGNVSNGDKIQLYVYTSNASWYVYTNYLAVKGEKSWVPKQETVSGAVTF
jgi:hypothetical protein